MPGGNLSLDLCCRRKGRGEGGLVLMSQWRLCAPELWPLVNTSVSFFPGISPSMITRHPRGLQVCVCFAEQPEPSIKSMLEERYEKYSNFNEFVMHANCLLNWSRPDVCKCN